MPGNRPLPSPSDEGKDGGFHRIIISHYVIVSKKENQIRCRNGSGSVSFLFSVWDKTTNNDRPQRYWQFLLTHPVWDGTTREIPKSTTAVISTHTSRAGWNPQAWRSSEFDNFFNSHIPCGMEPNKTRRAAIIRLFQLTHPVWDGTKCIKIGPAKLGISTHASRVGWNHSQVKTLYSHSISTHASRVGWNSKYSQHDCFSLVNIA